MDEQKKNKVNTCIVQWVQNVIPSQRDKVFNYPRLFLISSSSGGRAVVDTRSSFCLRHVLQPR